jgi:hypothetical protein
MEISSRMAGGWARLPSASDLAAVLAARPAIAGQVAHAAAVILNNADPAQSPAAEARPDGVDVYL